MYRRVVKKTTRLTWYARIHRARSRDH